MLISTPSHYFVCCGRAEGHSPLNAFDQALIAAGVGDVNLLRLTSILPPRCQRVEPFELPKGALVPAAYSRIESSNVGEVISAAIAIAIPEDRESPGLIMEHHDMAPLKNVRVQVREMAIQGMRFRQRPMADVIIAGTEHVVERHGAAFAGVVLWHAARAKR